ncbi:MAG: class I SAM-dependent methyltransferase, partial [Patescibacteria group bacterium]
KFGDVTGVDSSEMAVALANSAANHMIPELVDELHLTPRAQSRGYIQGKAVLGRAEDLPFENREFDLVTAFDVLEHLPDESRAIGEWGRVLRSGGVLFISVPAHQWLFGPHDRALNHYRRYELNQLLRLLIKNNFSPIFSTYIFGFSFPLFILQRGLLKNSPGRQTQYVNLPSWLNSLLISLGKLEAVWLRFSRFPFGSSIVILARKQQ